MASLCGLCCGSGVRDVAGGGCPPPWLIWAAPSPNAELVFTPLSPICQLLLLMAAVPPQKVWQCHFITPALGAPPPPTLPQPLSLSDQALHNPLSQCRLLPNLSGAGVAAGGIGDPPCTPPGTPQLCALLLTVMPALGSRVLVLGGRTWGRTLGTVRCPQSLAGLLRMSLGGVLAPSPHGAIGVPQGHRLARCSRSLQPGHRLNLRSPSLGDQSWDQPLVSPWRGTGVHSCPGAGQSMAPDPGGTEKVLGLQWPELIALRNCLNCSPVLPKQPL